MAIALDTATAAGTSQTSPLTWNHTCTGSNLLLVVITNLEDALSTTTATVTGVTYNGVAMTLSKRQRKDDAVNSSVETCIWMLFAPATGSNQVSVAWTTDGGFGYLTGGSISYTGAQQSSTADAVNSATGTTNGAQTVATVTVSDNCWIVNGITYKGAAMTITSTQTQRWNTTIDSSKGGGEDTNAAKSPAGSYDTGWTLGGTAAIWSMVSASFAPAAGGAVATKNLSLLGVGT